MKTVLIALSFGCLIGCQGPDLKCGIIHKPKAGCPAGYTETPEFFGQENGKSLPACVSPTKPQCIDYIAPGEGFTVRIPVDLPKETLPHA
jgi:hypothetical protein